jgi:hypothetical protein
MSPAFRRWVPRVKMRPLSGGDAAIAQLVEQRIRNAWVRGSNPLCGTIKLIKIRHLRADSVLARAFAVATFVPFSRPVFAFVHCQLPPPNQIIASASRMECLGHEARARSACSGLVRAMSNRLPRHFAQFAPSPLPMTVCNSRSPDWKPLRSAKNGNMGACD